MKLPLYSPLFPPPENRRAGERRYRFQHVERVQLLRLYGQTTLLTAGSAFGAGIAPFVLLQMWRANGPPPIINHRTVAGSSARN